MNKPDLLTVNDERRFGGLVRLYGAAGAARIREAHVVIIGLGGVGSWAAEALARSGVARLTLIDLDHIAESNINRQVHALDLTLGQAKVQAMRERIAHINSGCQVDCIEEFVDSENWPGIFSQDGPIGADRPLAFVDACDQVRAKTTLAAWAIKSKVPMISVGAAGGKRLAHLVDIQDLSAVTHDPLLAKMRTALRRNHRAKKTGRMNVACVFSREPTAQPLPGLDAIAPSNRGGASDLPPHTVRSLNCQGYGSVVTVTSTFGMCAAGWVINKISA